MTVANVLEPEIIVGGEWMLLRHQRHFLSLLARLPDSGHILVKDLLSLDKCSIPGLPLPRASHYRTSGRCKKPRKYDGLYDLRILRSLDDRDKRSINESQESLGLVVTKFSKIQSLSST